MTTPVAPTSVAGQVGPEAAARTWRSRRAWIATAVIAIWVPGCGVACWWQVGIALSGDALGWAYSVMWPCFAVFGIVAWWQFVHDDPDTVGARGLRRLRELAARDSSERPPPLSTGRTEPARDDDIVRAEAEDTELAEYNAYLASLAEEGPKTWRRSRSG